MYIAHNPVPYHADYFGHKLHIDQNEELVMFGVTHVCAVDGFSGKVVGFITMPVKNNDEVYAHLCPIKGFHQVITHSSVTHLS